jgi:hypothetical protein
MIEPGAMACGAAGHATPVAARIEAALADVEALAGEISGEPEALLALLRSIEGLHRRIQDGPFRACLPEDRNRLFELLAEMERSGGWPYIPRLQLRTFLDLLNLSEGDDDSSVAA